MPKKEFKLCYVRDNIMFFTDDFEHQCGDDWDDAPYEYNAEEPYEWVDEWTAEKNQKLGHSHIRYIAFKVWDMVREPKDGHYNSPYCVDDINKGAVPWLTLGWDDDAPKLYAGATMEEAIEWLKKAGAMWGELK